LPGPRLGSPFTCPQATAVRTVTHGRCSGAKVALMFRASARCLVILRSLFGVVPAIGGQGAKTACIRRSLHIRRVRAGLRAVLHA